MKKIALLLALIAAPALAQQKPNEALNDRISTRLGALMIQNEGLALQVEHLQARVKELEAAAKSAEPAPK